MTATWRNGPARPRLGAHEVHVWRVSLESSMTAIGRHTRALSDDERDRAAAFRRRRDAIRFVVAHAALRDVLGRYLDVEPDRIRFERGPHGKPRLSDDRVRFNLSHSGDLALCAVTRHREVGVDVEQIAPELADLRVAEAEFSESEIAALRALPDDARPAEFLALWTRKEAALKATGDGLAAPRRPFPADLTVKMLAPAPSYLGAVACEGDAWDLESWQWTCP